MRRIILLMGMSVDGCDAGGWVPEDDARSPEVQNEIWNQLASVDAFILGRVSYQAWFDFWPSQRDSEVQFYAAFARFADGVEKFVVSDTLTQSEWKNSRVIKGDLRAELAEVKQEPGKDIVIVGGAETARTIGNLQLIDEYRLWVRPIILAKGATLFDASSKPAGVTLIEAKTFGSGLLALHYKRN